jgi:hypothetical protein
MVYFGQTCLIVELKRVFKSNLILKNVEEFIILNKCDLNEISIEFEIVCSFNLKSDLN